jgi:hypothetical protein
MILLYKNINTGEYSCLAVDLVFKRQFSYYLITIYVPGCMLVIVSWVNFWLDPKVDRQAGRQTERLSGDRQTDKQTGSRTGITNRRTGGQYDRQIGKRQKN